MFVSAKNLGHQQFGPGYSQKPRSTSQWSQFSLLDQQPPPEYKLPSTRVSPSQISIFSC